MRAAIERVGGTMPEDIPTPDKSITQVEREQINKLKKSNRSAATSLSLSMRDGCWSNGLLVCAKILYFVVPLRNQMG